MIKQILILTAIATAISTSSCHTVAGAGQDIQKLGNSVQNTAIRTSHR